MNRTLRILLPCLWLLATSAGVAVGQEKQSAKVDAEPVVKLDVFPPAIQLIGLGAEQRLGVLGTFANGNQRDLHSAAKYISADSAIATVDETGVVRPVADGKTTIAVEFGGKKAVVPVEVTKTKTDSPVDFAREVVPILTRAGCNQGACHGAQHGRGGFRLSLRSFDPAFDYLEIVQSAEGRRIVPSDPARSIFLLKPTLSLDHGGGERFTTDSREYAVLLKWLEDGTPQPDRNAPPVIGMDVWPKHRLMKPGEKQQLVIQATWEDGRREDVTWTAQFDSLNPAVAEVSENGLITAKSNGETHIMVRFGGQAKVMQVTLPYAKAANAPEVAVNNFIDEKLAEKWKAVGLTPSDLCDDVAFFRRIHLDTIGTLPSPGDLEKFLVDKSPDKRKKAIDAVLNRPEFVDFWALKFGDLLGINRATLQDRGMWSFHNWVRASLRDNKPLDQMVSEIITAQGSTFTEGPANFFLIGRTASDWAENATQIFLGMRIQCAKCHHHPFEKWSQNAYAGMSAFFVRLGTKASQEFGLFGREQVVYLKTTGEQRHPRKGGVVPPHPLGGKETTDPLDRRVKLAEWMTSPENPYFARNLANRFWGYFMGRGLVEPLDDMRETNPPTIPDLLDAMADDLAKNEFDLKYLLRTIMSSRAYQLSSHSTDGNRADAENRFYTRFQVRRLTAEQLADALDEVTGTQQKYAGLPLGTRAIQLPDTGVASFLLDIFGRPPRKITCECERGTKPNIGQALHLMNSDFLNNKINNPKGRIAEWFKAKKKAPDMVRELYTVILSRPPSQAELERAMRWIEKAPNVREGVQDWMWALLNSREFLFIH